MELITILNRCHRFRGFVYQQAHFSADKKSIEVAVRPRKGSVAICSRCHLPAPGYDQLGERRFEFIPLWGFLVFLLAKKITLRAFSVYRSNIKCGSSEEIASAFLLREEKCYAAEILQERGLQLSIIREQSMPGL